MKSKTKNWKDSEFYKVFISDFNLFASLSQLLYSFAFTSLLGIVVIFWREGDLFKDSSPLILFIFFMILYLFVEKLDVIVSRYFGIGSIGTYTYLLFWVFAVINKSYTVGPIVSKFIGLLFMIGVVFKYIVPLFEKKQVNKK